MTDDVRDEFIAALQVLLNNFGATLTITDDGEPYGMASPVANVDIPPIWGDLDIIRERVSFRLPGYMRAIQ